MLNPNQPSEDSHFAVRGGKRQRVWEYSSKTKNITSNSHAHTQTYALMHKDMSKAKMGSTAQAPKENENQREKKLNENSILFIFDWLCDIHHTAAAAAADDRPKCIIIQKKPIWSVRSRALNRLQWFYTHIKCLVPFFESLSLFLIHSLILHCMNILFLHFLLFLFIPFYLRRRVSIHCLSSNVSGFFCILCVCVSWSNFFVWISFYNTHSVPYQWFHSIIFSWILKL